MQAVLRFCKGIAKTVGFTSLHDLCKAFAAPQHRPRIITSSQVGLEVTMQATTVGQPIHAFVSSPSGYKLRSSVKLEERSA